MSLEYELLPRELGLPETADAYGEQLRLSRLGRAILEDLQTPEDAEQAVLAVFLEITIKDGLIPISFLYSHTLRSSRRLLMRAIKELVGKGLITEDNDSFRKRIKLTVKGAIRLWAWDWAGG